MNTIVQSYNNFKNLMQKPSAKEIKKFTRAPGEVPWFRFGVVLVSKKSEKSENFRAGIVTEI